MKSRKQEREGPFLLDVDARQTELLDALRGAQDKASSIKEEARRKADQILAQAQEEAEASALSGEKGDTEDAGGHRENLIEEANAESRRLAKRADRRMREVGTLIFTRVMFKERR